VAKLVTHRFIETNHIQCVGHSEYIGIRLRVAAPAVLNAYYPAIGKRIRYDRQDFDGRVFNYDPLAAATAAAEQGVIRLMAWMRAL
jgi:hypothetical protein